MVVQNDVYYYNVVIIIVSCNIAYDECYFYSLQKFHQRDIISGFGDDKVNLYYICIKIKHTCFQNYSTIVPNGKENIKRQRKAVD